MLREFGQGNAMPEHDRADRGYGEEQDVTEGGATRAKALLTLNSRLLLPFAQGKGFHGSRHSE